MHSGQDQLPESFSLWTGYLLGKVALANLIVGNTSLSAAFETGNFLTSFFQMLLADTTGNSLSPHFEGTVFKFSPHQSDHFRF
tara:strand:+ start:60 stop:308 length:249 start_codon:yes stop_codon:yes gene_type:complete